VVDDETYTSYPETIEFLKNSGVFLKLDEYKSRTTHAKIAIVDNETAVLGSHNWTESTLTNNHEASILTDCPVSLKAFSTTSPTYGVMAEASST